jgi:hypothetical protein
MKQLAAVVLCLLPAAVAAKPFTPVDCAKMADILFMYIKGQPVPYPEEYKHVLMRAAEFYERAPERDAYFHSTTLFLECIRTNGDPKSMYDPRHLFDPEKPKRNT